MESAVASGGRVAAMTHRTVVYFCLFVFKERQVRYAARAVRCDAAHYSERQASSTARAESLRTLHAHDIHVRRGG